MCSDTDLIKLPDTNYNSIEVYFLGYFICDALYDAGFDFLKITPEQTALIISEYSANPEVWETGKKDLKLFGKCIAQLYLSSLNNFR